MSAKHNSRYELLASLRSRVLITMKEQRGCSVLEQPSASLSPAEQHWGMLIDQSSTFLRSKRNTLEVASSFKNGRSAKEVRAWTNLVGVPWMRCYCWINRKRGINHMSKRQAPRINAAVPVHTPLHKVSSNTHSC